MLKVVVDAPLLHEAGDEFKVGFVVLHAVVTYRISFNQAHFGGKGVVGEDCTDDFDRGLVLEDFAITGERGQVQPTDSLSSTTGEGELICRSRPHPVLFPAELGKLWLRYRDSRQQECSRKIKPTSALIANLKNGAPLCAWSIWALMHESGEKSNAKDVPINPRMLRLAYAESTSENALGEIAIIQGQIGKNLNPPRKPMERNRQRTLSTLHETTLKELRAAFR